MKKNLTWRSAIPLSLLIDSLSQFINFRSGFVAIFDDVLKTPFGYQAYWGNSFRVESLVPAPWSLLRQVSRCAKSLFGEAGADSAGEKDPGRKEDGFAICLLCPNSESQSKCHNVP